MADVVNEALAELKTVIADFVSDVEDALDSMDNGGDPAAVAASIREAIDTLKAADKKVEDTTGIKTPPADEAPPEENPA